jgi:sugar lactone lactonase YvrE
MTEPESLLVEAQALIDAQHNTDAVRLLQSHLERSPADVDADYLLGLAAYGAKDDDLAVDAFNRCLRADPENALAQFGLDMSLRQQHGDEADGSETESHGSPVPRRPRVLVLTVGLVLALTVAVVALILLQREPMRYDPIQVGDRPDGVAVARSVVWVASRDGTLTRSDPDQQSTRRIPLPIGENLDSVAIGGGSVWVTGEYEGKVARVDEDTGSVEDAITVGGRPKGLTVGGGAVWVANCRGTVIRIPLEPGSPTKVIRVAGQPRSVAVARGRVYIAVRPHYPRSPGCGRPPPGAFGHIAILDVSGKATRQRPVPVGDPSDIAFTKDWLWVADQARNRVLRVDPDTRDIEGEQRVAGLLTAIAADEDGVWALSRSPAPTRSDLGTVTRIDPGTGKRLGYSIVIDGEPQEIAVEIGRVWVTQLRTDKVTPIKP